MSSGTRARSAWRSLLPGLSVALVGLFCSSLFGWTLVTILRPPAGPAAPAHSAARAFQQRRGRQLLLSVRGEPYGIGVQLGRLQGAAMATSEERRMDRFARDAVLPERAWEAYWRTVMKVDSAYPLFTADENFILRGLVDGAEDPQPRFGSRFARVAAFHGLPELALNGDAQQRAAAALVAVGKGRSATGHALLAHNFDLGDAQPGVPASHLLVVRPSSGNGYVAISRPGMVGVLAGINEHGLVLALSAVGGAASGTAAGTPVSLLLRRALLGAANIDDARALLIGTPVLGSAVVVLAESSGRIALLELAGERHAVEEGELLFATSRLHLLRRQIGSSGESASGDGDWARLQRLHNLGNGRRFSPADLPTLLRDRRSVDGRELPLAHRHSIDPLTCEHSAIFDATAGRLWVAEGPFTFGAYHGYDVAALLAAESPEELGAAYLPSLPAHPMVAIAPLLAHARDNLAAAEQAIARGDTASAHLHMTRASVLIDHPRALVVRGLVARAKGEEQWARLYFTQAGRSPPEDERQAEQIRELLAVR